MSGVAGAGPCAPRAVARVVLGFTRALSEAGSDALSARWSGGFRWFSLTPRGPTGGLSRHFVAYSRGAALEWVRERGGVALRLHELVVGPRRHQPGADIAYHGEWLGTGGAGRERRSLTGKGFVECESGRVPVWSAAVGAPGERRASGLCPPPREPARGALVVCRR